MPRWFEGFDQAVGGVGDAIAGGGDFVLGGIGSTIQGLFTGAAETGGGVLGGLFGGLGTWVLQLAVVGAAAWIIVEAL